MDDKNLLICASLSMMSVMQQLCDEHLQKEQMGNGMPCIFATFSHVPQSMEPILLERAVSLCRPSHSVIFTSGAVYFL